MMAFAYDWLPRHKLTVADYHQMGRTGVRGEDERIEFVEGEIIDMTPIGSQPAYLLGSYKWTPIPFASY